MTAAVRPIRTAAETALAETYAAAKASLPGMPAQREQAFRRFEAQGLPHRRVEAWKYTDLRALMRDAKPLAPPPGAEAKARAKQGGAVFASVDARQVAPGRWEIFTHGGRNATGIEAVAFAREVVSLGAGELLVTSMDRDGTKVGYDLGLTRAIADAVSVPVIASGGVGDLDDLVAGVAQGHASAVLAASIFHFGTYTIGQAKAHMAQAGLRMRLD